MSARVSPVVMPQLGVNDDLVVLTEWLAEDGAQVKSGDAVAALETTKVSTTLEAEVSGFLIHGASPGDEIAVQATFAWIADASSEAEAREMIDADPATKVGGPSVDSQDEVRITSRAAALVEEHGIDQGLLPRGQIIREADVLALVGESSPGTPLAMNPGRRVAIYGASEGGSALAELILAIGAYEVVGFLDDTPGLAGTERDGLPIWPGDALEGLADKDVGSIASHIANGAFRVELCARAAKAGILALTAVHPSAVVAPSARLGAGVVVKAGAVIDTRTQVADGVIIDNGAIVAHDAEIGPGAHLAPGASLGGGVQIGALAVVGVGASIASRLSIGKGAIVASGAAVVRDVSEGQIVAGNPAREVGARRD